MRRIVILATLLSFIAISSYAAPNITNPSGTILNGESITIDGSSFGTKSPAAPLMWETFDPGTNGQYLSTDPDWPAYRGTGATYSSTSPYGGSGLSAYNHIEYPDPEEVGFQTNALVFPASDELYYSFMSRYSGNGTSGDIYKNGRINTGTSGSALYSGDGMIAISDGYLFYRPNGSSIYPSGRYFSTNLSSGNWQRHQMYGKLSTPAGTANGQIWVQVGNENKTYPNIVTRASGYSFQYRSVILGLMMANIESGDSHHMYVDDVYVDNTQARVEICAGSTWAARTDCNPQIPSQWSNTSITATVNQGAHSVGDTVYIYVVDADGNVNSSGFPITIGEIDTSNPPAPSAPTPPSNLRLVTALE